MANKLLDKLFDETLRDIGMSSNKHTSTCLAKAGEAEPIFVLRAQDQLAPLVVRSWARMAKEAGVPRAKLEAAHRLADEMLEWQEQYGAKRPD